MFSVIIPVYNCERTIRQVLDSVKRHGLRKMTAIDVCLRSFMPIPPAVFKKWVGGALGLFDESRQFYEDAPFYQRFLLHSAQGYISILHL